ncbi:MAG: hypothetical protein CML47_01330, partial [Rhodobacteraceae bacterium]
VSNNGNRYRSNNSSYHYDNVNDGNADTFWISGNNTDETIGIYFNEMQELVGFGLKWPNTSITTDSVHMRRRGTWTLYYTLDTISSISDAENATYFEILSPYYLGDPQTDGQDNVPTEVNFSFVEDIISGTNVISNVYTESRTIDLSSSLTYTRWGHVQDDQVTINWDNNFRIQGKFHATTANTGWGHMFEMGIKAAKPTGGSIDATDGTIAWYPCAGTSNRGFFVNSGAGGSDDRAYFFPIVNTGAFNANEETWFTIEWNSSNATFTLNFTNSFTSYDALAAQSDGLTESWADRAFVSGTPPPTGSFNYWIGIGATLMNYNYAWPGAVHEFQVQSGFQTITPGSPLFASGLKAEITGLDTGVEYSVSLGEFIAYLQDPPPEPEPEPEP